MTFVDDALQGRATIDDVSDYREAWDSSDVERFHDFLGLLWPEYAMWVEEGDLVLEYVIEARRAGTDLRTHVARSTDQSPAVTQLRGMIERYAEEWADSSL